MLLTTTSQISGKEITEYKGIVNGEVILGANAIIGTGMLMVAVSGTAVVIKE